MASSWARLPGTTGGWFDTVVMRILDIAMAFLFLVLIIVILAILGPGVHNIYIAVFLVAWTMYARLARAEMLVERNKDYMLAARMLGYGPRGSSSAMHCPISSTLRSSSPWPISSLNILLVSGLSFLGLGIQPPALEWGAMIAEADYILQAWWITTLPGVVVVITGAGLSLIGDGLAQRLGERQHTLAVMEVLVHRTPEAMVAPARARSHRVPQPEATIRRTPRSRSSSGAASSSGSSPNPER